LRGAECELQGNTVIALLLGGLANGAVYGLVAIGIVLVFRSTGIVSFAQGEFLMVGAYAYLVATRIHASGIGEFFIVVAVGVAFGLVFFVVTRYLLPRAEELIVVIATLALSIIMINLVRLQFTDLAFRTPGWLFGDSNIDTPFGVVSANSVLMLFAGLSAMVGLYSWFQFTDIGLAARAVAYDRALASLSGVPVAQILMLSWAAGGAFAAFGGLLLGPATGVYPLMGRDILFKGFTAAALGGFQSPVGAVLGGLLLGFFEVVFTAYLGSSYRDVVSFGLLLTVLLVRPTGLLGRAALRKV
jgi:branched-chain amino acid transport system permease protein